MGLQPVGVVCGHMSLQIIRPGKCSWASGAPVFLAWVAFVVIGRLGCDCCHGRKLRGNVQRRHRGVTVRRAVTGVRIIV